MIVPYAPGKYLNTALIETIDTTVSPPTVTVGGAVLAVQPAFVPRIRACIEADNTPLPPQPPPATPPPPLVMPPLT